MSRLKRVIIVVPRKFGYDGLLQDATGSIYELCGIKEKQADLHSKPQSPGQTSEF
jgi:hypothetical protein